MGRRKTKETKDEKTEKNGGAPRQATLIDPGRFMHHMNTFKAYKGRITTATGALRAARKACKAEGINPARIDDAIAMERGDPEEFRQEYADIAQVLKITGAPFQLQIFDTRFGNPVEQAKAEGRAAGRKGATMDCRWPEGSEPAEAYVEAYQAAQADLASGAFNGGEAIEEGARPIGEVVAAGGVVGAEHATH